MSPYTSADPCATACRSGLSSLTCTLSCPASRVADTSVAPTGGWLLASRAGAAGAAVTVSGLNVPATGISSDNFASAGTASNITQTTTSARGAIWGNHLPPSFQSEIGPAKKRFSASLIAKCLRFPAASMRVTSENLSASECSAALSESFLKATPIRRTPPY